MQADPSASSANTGSLADTSLAGSELAELLDRPVDAPRRRLFSLRASFFVAFFGGVFATAVFGFANARRMGRTRHDGWLLLLAAGAWAVFVIWVGYALTHDTLPGWLSFAGTGRSLRYLGRFVAMAVLGLLFLRQKPTADAQMEADEDHANPWPVALAALAVAALATGGLAFVGSILAG